MQKFTEYAVFAFSVNIDWEPEKAIAKKIYIKIEFVLSSIFFYSILK